MRDLQRTAGMAALGFVLVLALAACGIASSEGHPGHGVVEAVDADARRVTIDHEDIPGFMMGMTMAFDVAPGVSMEGIGQGTEIDFRVKEEGGVYTVTEIRRSGS